MLRARAAAIAVRERELDQVEKKLALRERRLGRRLRALRTERSWFMPVKNRFADPTQAQQLERMRADLKRREHELLRAESELDQRRDQRGDGATDGLEREALDLARGEAELRE